MNDRKTSAEMIGEGLRELAVLFVVFVPLDYLFSDGAALTVGRVSAIVIVAIGVFGLGVRIERNRT